MLVNTVSTDFCFKVTDHERLIRYLMNFSFISIDFFVTSPSQKKIETISCTMRKVVILHILLFQLCNKKRPILFCVVSYTKQFQTHHNRYTLFFLQCTLCGNSFTKHNFAT